MILSVPLIFHADADMSRFSYEINLDGLDSKLCERLDEANIAEEQAAIEDLDSVRTTIAEDMAQKYKAHCQMFPQKFKTPGIEKYRLVRDAVFERWGYVFKDFIQGKVSGDGKETFLRRFTFKVENDCRNNMAVEVPQRRARVGGGVVEARKSSYRPAILPDERPTLEEEKSQLRIMFERRRSQWNRTTIQKLMHSTFSLQRHDIDTYKSNIGTVINKKNTCISCAT